PLAGIEPEGDASLLFHPEILVEALLEHARLPPQLAPLPPLSQDDRQRRHVLKRGVVVTLHLTRSERRVHLASLLIDHRVLAVLPSLVRRPQLGFGQVFQIPIPIAITILAGPGENALSRRPVVADALLVTGEDVEVAEPDDEHERAGEIRVVAAEWGLPQPRGGIRSRLVEDATGLLIVAGVDPLALSAHQEREHIGQHLTAVEDPRLPGSGHGVPGPEGQVEG